MSKSGFGYEVPNEMREMAEKSVDQAKKAFDGFVGAASKAVEAAETHTANAHAQSRDMAKKAIGYAEQNVTAAFDLAQRLVHAKDVEDVVRIQSDFLKSQMSALQSQLTDIGSVVQENAKKAAADVQSTVEKAAQEVRKAATEATSRKS